MDIKYDVMKDLKVLKIKCEEKLDLPSSVKAQLTPAE